MKWLVLAAALCFPTGAMAQTCNGQISPEFAKQFADNWIAAWNSHDLARILEHYADDLEMYAPGIITVAGEPGGRLQGKAKVAAFGRRL